MKNLVDIIGCYIVGIEETHTNLIGQHRKKRDVEIDNMQYNVIIIHFDSQK